MEKLNLKIVSNPIISNNLAIIRDKNTDSEKFSSALKRIAYALFYEASNNLPLVDVNIETPVANANCSVFDKDMQLIVAPILRAGLIFQEIAQKLFPFANIHHIGMYRDEKTLEPVWYYDKRKEIKKDKNKVYVMILDPMLATGNSSVYSIENFINKGVLEQNITFISLIASLQGIENVNSKFPNVKIITASLDEKLNYKGYIVPGLGDAGDRIFNTLD